MKVFGDDLVVRESRLGSLEVGESLVVVWYGMRVVGGFQIV